MKDVFKEFDDVVEMLKDNVVFVPEQERFADEFIDPTGYFIVNALNEGVYFKTRARNKAQEWADMLYGRNTYIVRKSIKAAIR